MEYPLHNNFGSSAPANANQNGLFVILPYIAASFKPDILL